MRVETVTPALKDPEPSLQPRG